MLQPDTMSASASAAVLMADARTARRWHAGGLPARLHAPGLASERRQFITLFDVMRLQLADLAGVLFENPRDADADGAFGLRCCHAQGIERDAQRRDLHLQVAGRARDGPLDRRQIECRGARLADHSAHQPQTPMALAVCDARQTTIASLVSTLIADSFDTTRSCAVRWPTQLAGRLK